MSEANITSRLAHYMAHAREAPVLGDAPTKEVIQRVNALEALRDVRALRPFHALASH